MLSIENRRKWFGDQRLGGFYVSLDGVKVGFVLPGHHLKLPIEAGAHILRVRQWWYRSAPLHFEAQPEDDIYLGADIVRSGGTGRRVLAFLLRPSQALSIDRLSGGSS